jgi:hypothetical protein
MFSRFSVHLRKVDALTLQDFHQQIKNSYNNCQTEHLFDIANIRDYLDGYILPITRITKPLHFKLTSNTVTGEPHLFTRPNCNSSWEDTGEIFAITAPKEFNHKVPNHLPKTLNPLLQDKLIKAHSVFARILTREQSAENLKLIAETLDTKASVFHWQNNGYVYIILLR